MTIRPCTVDEIFESGLIPEYAAESGIKKMPAPNPDINTYRGMESLGAITCIGAFDDDIQIGFAVVLVTTLPHYGEKVAATESLFVSKSHRKSSAGARLIGAAEVVAANLGAKGLLISAGHGTQLEKVMQLSRRYNQTNSVFFRALA